MVGARKATDAGLRTATNIARIWRQRIHGGLRPGGGHRHGRPHRRTRQEGRTVAVIGTGLARAYPPENERLQRRLANEYAVISQFWPESPPSRRSFPMRNAVMSGVALATVVVEASETSGARMQARLALAQGRPVFLLDVLTRRQPWAREYATRPGTHVISEPAEVTRALERLIASDPLLA